MRHQWLFLSLLHGSIARPNLIVTREDQKFEWTSLGDSYASGVGSTNYVSGRRCLRYDQAWPVLLNGDSKLAGTDYIFNNVVCSGSHYDDVEKYQFYDDDTSSQPNLQFGRSSSYLGTPVVKDLRRARFAAKIWQSADGDSGRWRGRYRFPRYTLQLRPRNPYTGWSSAEKLR